MSAHTRQFDVASVKSDFPILHKPLPKGIPVVYLDSAASAQKPQSVINKETEVYEDYFANAARGRYYFGARIDEELQASRARVAEFIGAESPNEIVFTTGTTMSINLAAAGWGRRFLNAGDEIIVSEMEHHANLVPWQQIARERGAVLRYLPLTDDGRLDLDRADEVFSSRTRMLAICGMSNAFGTVNPISKLTAMAGECGATVLVDAAQSITHLPVDVAAENIDFLAFSGHKLFGPSGVGVLYGRLELLRQMEPFLTGGHMIDRVYRDHSTWTEPPAKFEAGTLPIAQAIALGSAIDYVSQFDPESIQAHENTLLATAHEQLEEIPGMQIHGPSIEHKGSIVCFNIHGIHPEDLALMLDRRGVFTRHGHHCTMPLHDWLGVPATTRASFAMYNTTEDVDALVAAIEFARTKLIRS